MVSPLVTQTATWDGVYSIYANNFVGESGFKDQFYKERPLLDMLREKGLKASGGKQIVHRVNLGSSAIGGSGSRGKKFDMAAVDPWTAVRYDRAYYKEPCLVYYEDEEQAGGSPESRLSLVGENLTDTGARLRDLVLQHLCAETKASSTDINTLIQFVRVDPDGADTDLMGGLSAATYSAWRNQANEAAVDFSAVGEKAMRDLEIDCTRGGAPVTDLWLFTSEFYSQYVDLAAARHQTNSGATRAGTRVADVAFSGASFNGRPVIWDPAFDTASASHNDVYGLALDLRGLHLVEGANAFAMTPFVSTLVNGVDAKVAWMRYDAQLTCSERRTQGIFKNLD